MANIHTVGDLIERLTRFPSTMRVCAASDLNGSSERFEPISMVGWLPGAEEEVVAVLYTPPASAGTA